MATLTEIYTKILESLEREAGSSDFWISDEIKDYINDLYINTCRYSRILRTRDVSTVSVADQPNYNLPNKCLQVFSMTYDGEPIFPTTIAELNAYSFTWRTANSSTPLWWYFEIGKEYTEINLYPTPQNSGEEIGFDHAYLPDSLGDTDEPEEPFRDGLILEAGVMSVSLAKEGAGQNIDRSEFYWNKFLAFINNALSMYKKPDRVHVLRSIEDGGLARGINRGPRLPSNYPPYKF